MVFGSFYNSEIKIGRDNVMQILVIAQYLLLDEVFENCLKLAVQWVDNNVLELVLIILISSLIMVV